MHERLDAELLGQAVKVMNQLMAQEIKPTCFDVIGTRVQTKQVQARTHKKKRINKKWLKRYGMKSVPDLDQFIYTTDGCIYCHEKAVPKFKKLVQEYSERNIE